MWEARKAQCHDLGYTSIMSAKQGWPTGFYAAVKESGAGRDLIIWCRQCCCCRLVRQGVPGFEVETFIAAKGLSNHPVVIVGSKLRYVS